MGTATIDTRMPLPRLAALAALTAVVTAALTTMALAADLSRGPGGQPEPVGYAPRIETGNWPGFYIGLTYGYATGWAEVSRPGADFDIDLSGGNGTVLAGYNWQLGRFVTSLEADLGLGTLGGAENAVAVDIGTFGAIRGRLGYLLTPSFLIYATAGFALADFDFDTLEESRSEIFTGYQIGAGTELRFSEPWSLRLDYIYTDLGSETIEHAGVRHTYEPDFHTVRAGLTFKF